MENLTNTTEIEFINPFALLDIVLSVAFRFWFYLFFNVFSILCSIFVLYHLLFDRTLRRALNNHIIIVLLFTGLIYELTTVPLMLHYYQVGDSWKITPIFANFWTFIDYSTYAVELIGFAWATIERHILIFHQSWVLTRKKRFFVHYLPIISILSYCFTYYFLVIFFPTCKDLNVFQPLNGVPPSCMSFHPILGKWDTICHQILPTFTVVIFSSALLIRVLWQKNRLNRSIQWRQQRKMIIQLLSISALYLFFNFPRSIVQIYIASILTTYLIIKIFAYQIFFSIQLIFLFPFVCCATIPEIGKRLKKFLFWKNQQRAIAPVALTTVRTGIRQTVTRARNGPHFRGP